LSGTVQTIADFLGIDLDEALFEIVVKQASLDFMRAHKSKFSDPSCGSLSQTWFFTTKRYHHQG
jgi:hypothetical protein